MSFNSPSPFLSNSLPVFAVPTNPHDLPLDLLSDLDSDFESEYDPSQTSSSLNGNSSQSGSRITVGRKKNEFTLILEKFFTKNSKNPKKEFINAFIIRSIRRFFRNAKMDKQPIKTCLAINEINEVDKKIWTTVKNIYSTDPEYFDKVGLTTSAPLTDGKAKRKERNAGNRAKSHNNDFCKKFFEDKRMQKAFYVVMDLLFSGSDPNKLKKRWNFFCCMGLEHFEECFEKWNQLKRYFYYKYLPDLDLTVDKELLKLPFEPIRIEPRLDEIHFIDENSFLGDLEDLM